MDRRVNTMIWIRRRQAELSDCVHQAGDDFARAQDWVIDRSSGRFGLGSREYHDPRFDQRKTAVGRRPAAAISSPVVWPVGARP